jgi:hypothetical protein
LKGFSVKRILAAAALAAAMALPALPSMAAGTPSYGSVKMSWSVNTTATMTLATQYSAAGAQGLAAPNLLPSAAGVCAGSGTETAFNMTFGAINPNLGAAVGCLYANAVSASVTTNDSAGFKVNEYLDAAPAGGAGFCAYPNGGAAFPLTAAAVVQTARSGNPAAGTFAGAVLTCPAPGQAVPVGTGGALNAGTTPGNPGTASLEFYSAATNGINVVSNPGQALTAVFAGQDIQLNLPAGAPSTAATQSSYMTIQLFPN